MKYTKTFSELNKDSVDQAGGKGASLGEMTQAGLAVPPGFVVLASTFDEFLKVTDINVEIDAALHDVDPASMHTVENASEKIQGIIHGATMPTEIAEQIKKDHATLGAEFVAVRSSATSEDSADHAWAGQLDTYLNTTSDMLIENVQKCWASLFTPRAIFYRFEKELHNTSISVAVVVQKMIQSEVSGIAFSVHPVTQDHNQLIIEAGFGLGEAIVSGSITPDSYVVEKDPHAILDINVAEQTRKMQKKAEGGGDPLSHEASEGQVEWVDIDATEGGKQKLSGKQIIELSTLVQNIEKHYGFPCDIEWAQEGNEFYITQSRPITTLG